MHSNEMEDVEVGSGEICALFGIDMWLIFLQIFIHGFLREGNER